MSGVHDLAEQNVIEVPIYTRFDAVRYLRAPVPIVLSISGLYDVDPIRLRERWIESPRFREHFSNDFFRVGRQDEVERISFRSLVNLFIHVAVFRQLYDHYFTIQKYSSNTTFLRIMDLFEDSEVICKRTIKQIEPPELLTDPEWVANQYESHYKRLSAEERPTLLKVIALHQSRVETREGVPVQLFPFTRAPALDTPRFVVIDPEIRFGRPTVKGVPTDVLMERWHAGDPVANLAEDYNVPTEEIEEALRYESSSFSPFGFFPFEPLRFPW